MRNRRPLVPVLLVAVLGTVIAALAAACAGSSHGGEPCCGATGEVPPTGQSFTATPSLTVGAVLVDTSSCPVINGDGTITVTTTDIGLKDSIPGSAGTNGRYSVTFNRSAIGKRGYIALEDATSHAILGLGVVQAPLAQQSLTNPYHVAPIRYVGGPGKSTIELVSYCQLDKHGLLGPLVLPDVRALITDDVAASGYNPSTDNYLATDTASIVSVLGPFRVAATAMQTLGGLPPGTVEQAQENVDKCLDGVSPFNAPLIDCSGANTLAASREADLYRFWTYATVGTSATEALSAASEGLAQSLAIAGASNPIVTSMQRRVQLARFEAAAVAIRRDVTTLGIDPTNSAAIDAKLINARDTLTTFTDPASAAGTIQADFDGIVNTVQAAVVLPSESTSCTVLAAYNNGHAAIPNFNWSSATGIPTILTDMFNPASGTGSIWDKVESSLGVCTSSLGVAFSPREHAAVDLDTFAAINASLAP